jgi:hypothetical protein
MISELLKKEKNTLWNVIQGNNSAKQKLKSIDSTWKQIEKLVQSEMKLLNKK